MNDKKMTFDEFKNKVKQELALYLNDDANSEKVQERMNEPDSRDVIESEYGNYLIRIEDQNRADKPHRREFACAASSIYML